MKLFHKDPKQRKIMRETSPASGSTCRFEQVDKESQGDNFEVFCSALGFLTLFLSWMIQNGNLSDYQSTKSIYEQNLAILMPGPLKRDIDETQIRVCEANKDTSARAKLTLAGAYVGYIQQIANTVWQYSHIIDSFNLYDSVITQRLNHYHDTAFQAWKKSSLEWGKNGQIALVRQLADYCHQFDRDSMKFLSGPVLAGYARNQKKIDSNFSAYKWWYIFGSALLALAFVLKYDLRNRIFHK